MKVEIIDKPKIEEPIELKFMEAENGTLFWYEGEHKILDNLNIKTGESRSMELVTGINLEDVGRASLIYSLPQDKIVQISNGN